MKKTEQLEWKKKSDGVVECFHVEHSSNNYVSVVYSDGERHHYIQRRTVYLNTEMDKAQSNTETSKFLFSLDKKFENFILLSKCFSVYHKTSNFWPNEMFHLCKLLILRAYLWFFVLNNKNEATSGFFSSSFL